MAVPKKGLGSKGLGMEALINNQMNDFQESGKEGNVLEIDINKIEPNQEQPRRHFEENALEELAASIKQYGIIQPIVVQKIDDYFQIIAGERRWRAAKIAELKSVPVIVKDCKGSTAFELALVENLQREDLNPIEEASSFKYLCEQCNMSQEEVAEKVGKNRSTIANSMRLLNLDVRVQNFVIEGKLSNGHARTLLSLENGNQQFELAEKIIEDILSVRETEILVKKELDYSINERRENPKNQNCFQTEGYKELENSLKNILGTKVKLSANKNKGKIEIEYYSDEDLDRLIGLMKNLN